MDRMAIKERWEFPFNITVRTFEFKDNFKLQVKSCVPNFLELTILRTEI